MRLWYFALGWLGLCFLAAGYFAIRWTETENPLRHEIPLGAAMAAFYSWPAVVVAAFIWWKWPSASSVIERRLALGLVAAIALVVVTLSVLS
jgi:hypothetical protein